MPGMKNNVKNVTPISRRMRRISFVINAMMKSMAILRINLATMAASVK